MDQNIAFFSRGKTLERPIKPIEGGASLDCARHAFIKIACSNCSLRELCMPIGMNAGELARIEDRKSVV